ncbi:uncharacterized protein NPIL_426481 [Nephila pilipes]|uniref:Uncharacterized protein n=1 Tax=Nephila pilipes TaxID=299642 RepID=A0A8X6Q3W7_NEPPI|nr:uncharacterized protein NPIL_426481 [Nephila pilipes]
MARGCSWVEWMMYVGRLSPVRSTKRIKATPLCPAKVCRYWELNQPSTSGAPVFDDHRSCAFFTIYDYKLSEIHAASVIAQFKKDCNLVKQPVFQEKKYFWNFKKANWESFTSPINYEVSKTPNTNSVDSDWITLKNIIIRNAKKIIPRGSSKKHKKFFTHNTQPLQDLLDERKQLFGALDALTDNLTRTKLQQINAEIKTHAKIKQNKWNELCTTHDSRVPNTKLWSLMKNISKDQPQVEKINMIQDFDGTISKNDTEAANLKGQLKSPWPDT